MVYIANWGDYYARYATFFEGTRQVQEETSLRKDQVLQLYIYLSAIFLRGVPCHSAFIDRSPTENHFLYFGFTNNIIKKSPCFFLDNLCLLCFRCFYFAPWDSSPSFTTICLFLLPASEKPTQDDDFVKAMMQRMQQKQKDAVATLAVEGLVGFREIF